MSFQRRQEKEKKNNWDRSVGGFFLFFFHRWCNFVNHYEF